MVLFYRSVTILLVILFAFDRSIQEEFRDAENETSVVLIKSEFDDVVDESNDNKRQVKVETVTDLSSDIDPNVERFIPTREWQEIKEGQAIPPGLHVRLNFQTHIREAKLLDPKPEKPSNLKEKIKQPNQVEEDDKEIKIVHYEPEDKLDDDKIYISKDELKYALKDFRDKFHNHDDSISEMTADDADVPPPEKKFRSMKEIRSDLEHLMGHKLQTDVDVMKLDINTILSTDTHIIDKENALNNLENYVHQLDNGKDLEKINGLIVVINLLNDSHVSLQEKAARVLGSACQSNPTVQSSAAKHGALIHLFRIILDKDTTQKLQKSTLFALSALVRGHSAAQEEFIKLDGLSHVLKLLKNDKQASVIRIKAMNLLADLIIEQREAAGLSESENLSYKFKESPLEVALVNHGWCSTLPGFLTGSNQDIQEKTLQAMRISVHLCKKEFLSNNSLDKLNILLKHLMLQSKQEDDRDFASYLNDLIREANYIITSLST